MTSTDDRPILFFDSGVGGLSVLAEAQRLLPQASTVYVADSAGFPYGTKSESEIAARVPALLGRLAERYHPRLIVIACNTASTIALASVRAALDLPIVGTVPAIKPAAAFSKTRVIGVLGTNATVRQPYVDNLAACEELQKRGMRATWFIVSGSIGQPPRWPEDGRPAGRLLNADELREMRENGMEVGSHTVSHTRMTGLDDMNLMRELAHSKATLEDLLGSPVDSFAYPYGDWDARCVEAVQQAGYSAACTTRTGWALRDNTPYQLRRLTVFNTDTTSSFARKLYFGSHDVRWRDIARYALRRFRSA